MITVSNTYRTNADNKPLEYLIQISEDGGTTWQDIPTGAQVVDRPGDLTNEVETNMPFNFVGPDCELVCENIAGYWTNDGKTGKLDTGAQVQLLLQSRPAGATDYIKHIQGPIDLSSLRKLDRPFISFIVRGTLNMLDEIFANYVLADRPGKYPWAFNYSIKITAISPSHPEGLYLLKYKDGQMTWNNGVGVSVKDQYNEQELTGQDGNKISILFYNASDDYTALIPPEASQYLAIKKDSNNVLQVYQVNPFNSVQRIKELVSDYIDLDIDDVENINTVLPDINIATYAPDGNTHEKLNPICIVSRFRNTFYVSFGTGPMSGVWMVTIGTDISVTKMDSNFTGSGVLVKGINLSYENSMAYTYKIYFLYDTAATPEYNNDQWLSSWEIREYNLLTGEIVVLPGSQHIAWRSFSGCLKSQAGSVINELYALRVAARRAGNSGYIVKMTWSGTTITYANKSAALTTIDNSVSLFPATVIGAQFYCLADSRRNFTTGYVDQTLYVYDLVAATNATAFALSDIKLKIDYDFKTVAGAVYMIPTGPVSSELPATEVSNLAVLISIGGCTAITPDFITPTYTYIRSINGAGRKLFSVVLSGGAGNMIRVYRGIVKPMYGANNNFLNKDVLYIDYIGDNLVGKTIKFITGDNAGDSQGILTQTDTKGGALGAGNRGGSKITFSAFADNITPGDVYEIYNTTLTGAVASSSEISMDDIDIMTHNPGDDNNYGLIISDGSIYKNVSTGKSELSYIHKVKITHTQDESLAGGSSLRNPSGKEFGKGTHEPKAVEYFTKNVKIVTPKFIPLVDGLLHSSALAAAYEANDAPGQIVTRNFVLLATNDGLIGLSLYASAHKPAFINSDYGPGTLREVVQDLASLSNCRMIPSEHYKKIKYTYRGTSIPATFTLTPDDYVFDHNYCPFYNFRAVSVNGKTYGQIENKKFGYTLSLDIPAIPECLSYGLAKDIYTHIGSGDRLHSIKTTWKVWLEPGDCGYLQTPEGGTTKVLVVSANTDFTNRIHQLTVLEVAEWGNQ